MEDKLRITKTTKDGVVEVTLDGIIDEDSDLAPVFAEGEGALRVNFRGVQRINSCGVREWVNALKKGGSGRTIEFVECSVAIVEQFNMIANFAGAGRIISFLAPYVCEDCDIEEEKLLLVGEHFPDPDDLVAPGFPCGNCGNPMEFDDDEDEYFQFIEMQQGA